MKDHEIADLVNELRDIALQYHDKQCLRDVISRAVRSRLVGNEIRNQLSSAIGQSDLAGVKPIGGIAGVAHDKDSAIAIAAQQMRIGISEVDLHQRRILFNLGE